MRFLIQRTLTFVAMLAALLWSSSTSQAGILEDFSFSDPNGTLIEDVTNDAGTGHTFSSNGILTNSSVQNGAFHVQNDNDSFAQLHFDIDNVSTGKIWLVAEIDGWSFSNDEVNPANFNASEREQIRFAFLDNDNNPPSGSTLFGQAYIQRVDADNFELIGEMSGTANDIPGSQTLSRTQSNPFTVVVEVDQTAANESYSVFFKDGTDDFATIGTAPLPAGRDANSVRLAFNNNFSGDGEFFDLDRLYVTDMDPLGEVAPSTLSLEVNTTTGKISILNETDNPISLDRYRIGSDSSSLEFDNWVTLESQGLDVVDDGLDPGETWSPAGGSSDSVLAESFLLGNTTINNGDPGLSLGFNVFKNGGTEDLTFEYHDATSGAVFSVLPTYVMGGGIDGDYNGNGVVDAADYSVWLAALGGTTLLNDPTPGTVDDSDYTFWKNNFGTGAASGTGGSAPIPEPASLLLLLGCAVPLMVSRSQR